MSRNQNGCARFISNPLWQSLAAFATILAFIFAIFVWIVPSFNTLAHSTQIINKATTPSENMCGVTTNQIICTYRHHKGSVNTVAWSPDGKKIASGGDDGTVQVWDATTGAVILTYRGHKGRVNTVAWSPDSQQIASGGDDGTVQVWSSSNGTLVDPPVTSGGFQFSNSSKTSPVIALAWSPDGQYIAFTRQDGNVYIFSADLGNEDRNAILIQAPSGSGPVTAVAWSTDSKLIAIDRTESEQSVAEIWNIDVYPPNKFATYVPSTIYITTLAWSPDGKFIATSERDVEIFSGIVTVWNALKPNGSSSIGIPVHFGDTSVGTMAWSPDSKCLALGSAFLGEVEVWSLDAQKQITLYTGQETGQMNAIESVAWSPDGTRIASASQDGTVKIWKVDQKGACSG